MIRINSQSGKGGVAYALEKESGYQLPRRMQMEFSSVVQASAEATGEELSHERVGVLFEREYLGLETGPRLTGERRLAAQGDGAEERLEATLAWGELQLSLRGQGSGPLDAFVRALAAALGISIRIGDFHEHALGAGADATAAAYVEVVFGPDRRLFGAGRAASIVEASFEAVLSAIARAVDRGWIASPSGR